MFNKLDGLLAKPYARMMTDIFKSADSGEYERHISTLVALRGVTFKEATEQHMMAMGTMQSSQSFSTAKKPIKLVHGLGLPSLPLPHSFASASVPLSA